MLEVDISPIVAKKKGKRVSIDLDIYFETRVPCKFRNKAILGKGEAFNYPVDKEIYIQDLSIRQTPYKTKALPLNKHYNTKELWKSFESWIGKNFAETKHLTTPMVENYVVGGMKNS